ncbi:hypothetical protein NXS19_008286 [Fusarium pseudograminearum]|nr:hypothetical protein NXS19_008286 [Fusarium pseudograminearum]
MTTRHAITHGTSPKTRSTTGRTYGTAALSFIPPPKGSRAISKYLGSERALLHFIFEITKFHQFRVVPIHVGFIPGMTADDDNVNHLFLFLPRHPYPPKKIGETSDAVVFPRAVWLEPPP